MRYFFIQFFKASIIVLIIIAIGIALGCYFFSAPEYKGPVSEHFNGKIFFNPSLMEKRGMLDFLKWFFSRSKGAWIPIRNTLPGSPPPQKVSEGNLRITYINHSTVLIQMDGLNILTDPIWSKRASPVSWIGPDRHHYPGIRYEDLPPIDLVLISHNHYDQLDIPTIKRLYKSFNPKIFAGLGNKALFDENDIDTASDLDWWNTVKLDNDVEITFVPAVHFSGRGLCDRDKTLWGGFVIKGPSGVVYFAGDTGMGQQFDEIKERFGPVRAALLPIGAFLPRWFMGPVHLSPQEALEVHKKLDPKTSLGIHYGTFRLADDAQFEPTADIAKAVIKDPGLSNFWILDFGEGRNLP